MLRDFNFLDKNSFSGEQNVDVMGLTEDCLFKQIWKILPDVSQKASRNWEYEKITYPQLN